MADAPKLENSDTLLTGYDKINKSIDNSNEALTKSTESLSNSESTQTQLDQVVIDGDSSVEAAQARVDADGDSYTTLKDRLDTEHTDVTSQLAEKVNKGDLVVNVKNIGAIGDGVTDDVLSIQNAIDNGSFVYFPDGDYRITKSVNITKSDLVLLFSPNARLTIDADDFAIIANTIGLSNVKIIRPTIISNGKGPNNGGFIQINYVTDFLIEDYKLKSDRTALNTNQRLSNGFSSALGASGVLRDCHTKGSSKSGYHISTDSENITLVNCIAEDTGTHDTTQYGSSPGFDATGKNIVFDNCRAFNTQGSGLLLSVGGAGDKAENVTVKGGYFYNNTLNGVEFASNSLPTKPTNIEINNVFCFGNGNDGINLAVGLNVTVNQGEFFQNGKTGIFVDQYAEQITLNKVKIFENAQNTDLASILLRGCDNIRIYEPEIFDNQTTPTQTKGIGAINTQPTNIFIEMPKFINISSPYFWSVAPSGGVFRIHGSGIPSGSIQAPIGSTYLRTDGGAGTTFYVAESQNTFVAK